MKTMKKIKIKDKLVITSLDTIISIRDGKGYDQLSESYPLIDFDHNMMVIGINHQFVKEDGIDAIRVPVKRKELIEHAPNELRRFQKGRWMYLLYNPNLLISEGGDEDVK